MQVGRGVGVEHVEQLLVPDAAEEPDAAVGQAVHPGGVLVGVGGGADDDQRLGGAAGGVALDDLGDVVLRLEPGDDQVVAAGGEAELGEAVGGRVDDRGAVGDEVGRGAELLG